MKLFWLSIILAVALYSQETRVQSLIVQTTDGARREFRPSESKVTVVVFVSAVCPMSAEYSDRLAELARQYSSKGVRFLLVNSNVNETNAEVEEQRTAAKLPMPIYRDQGSLANTLGAIATPTAVVIDQTGAQRYLGMIDNSRNPARVTKQLLRLALNDVLAGRTVEIARTKVMSCTIKSAERR
jgi:hypothetical protein